MSEDGKNTLRQVQNMKSIEEFGPNVDINSRIEEGPERTAEMAYREAVLIIMILPWLSGREGLHSSVRVVRAGERPVLNRLGPNFIE
jgi:hypothetical protein